MLSFLRKLLHQETDGVAAAAFIVGAASLASRLVGLLRDRVLAATFGAGDVLDAYYAAFRIPDFLYNLVILGALSAAFIPVFTEYMETRTKEDAWKLASRMLSMVSVVMAVACVGLFLFAPQIVPLTVPGFTGEKLGMTITLSRVMLLSTFFLAMSAVMGGVLQSLRRFFAFSIAPVLYNIGIIFGAVVLVPMMGAVGLGWGVVVGALFHFLIQAFVARGLGMPTWGALTIRDAGVHRILMLMGPRTAGLAVAQINLIIILAFASSLSQGSVTVLNFAMNLQYVPIGLFAISFAVAAFPQLSRFAAPQDAASFRKALHDATRMVLFLILPSAAILIVLRAQIVRVLLGAGAFDWDATIRTADALAIFAFSLLPQALQPLYARAFYALQQTWTPFFIGVAAEIVNLVFAWFFYVRFGVAGLAAAFSISAWVGMGLMFWQLRRKRGSLGLRSLWPSYGTAILGSIALMVSAYFARTVIGTWYPLRTLWQVSLQAGCAAFVGCAAFIGVAILCKSPEWRELSETIRRRVWRRAKVTEGAGEAQGV
ncbi:MAG: murein biosynthesis integral membrane protein MurJ [Candidatus Uhrbacteria bacterium]|nr:murein biosynthesis integral membrane protein MurJ [Candidatus Uhrbacteria bacterium]